ncbi:lipid II:glycine glycyltransferase FemX [Saccharopolyspora rosea]|uniref:Lipid II:glycine glycyltransferase FemX n=1 Tax=Saccharopolyspora rosea TaxID=524884 RepID=A0ABW3FR40_9PSEU|nr:GNAT family N-acetyltransferase [Saccharopolyspora rosea]
MTSTEWIEGSVSAVAVAEADQAALRAWDRLVAETPGSDVSQLHAWARVRSTAGFGRLHVFVHRGTTLVAGAQILVRRLPGIGAIGYLPYGPVVAAAGPEREHVLEVLGRALATLAKNRLIMLFVQPPESADGIVPILLRAGFRRSTAGIAPIGSVRVDLSIDEEGLRKGLRNHRLSRFAKNRRWESRGLKVRIGDEQDVPVLSELMVCTAARQGFDPLSTDYLAALYRELAATGHVTLFIGEIDGVPVASHLYTLCADTVKYRLTGFDRDRDVAGVGAPGVLHWEAMRWAKAEGYRWFDFGGLNEVSLGAAADGNRAGIPSHDSFKLDFGGTPYRFPAPVELIASPWLRRAYDAARCWPGGRRLIARTARLLRGGR